MELIDILNGVMATLRVEVLGGISRPGEPVKARVGPVPPEIDLVEVHSLPVNLTAVLDPAVIGATLDPATRISKNVQFKEIYPEAPALDNLGGRTPETKRIEQETPFVLPTGGLAAVPGVSGLLQQFSGLAGTLNIPQLIGSIEGSVGVPVLTRRPLSLRVDWKVKEKLPKENPAEPDKYRDLQEGKDFLAPGGLTGAEPSFILLPAVSSKADAAPTLVRYLQATVKLAAGDQSLEQALDPVGVPVPGLVLPLAVLLGVTGMGGVVPEPGLPATASIGPDLSTLKTVTGAFDAVWDEAATGVQGLRIPLQAKWTVSRDRAGTDVVADDGNFFAGARLVGPALSLVFRPNVVQAVRGAPQVGPVALSEAWVTAQVRIAGETDWVRLPAVKLPVPTLRLPTVLAMFNHRAFSLATYGGIPPCVLVVIPSDSDIGPSTPETIISTLTAFRDALGRLAGPFPRLNGLGTLGFFIPPIGRLVDLLATVHASAVPGEEKGWKLLVRPSSEEAELDDIVFYRELLSKESAQDTFGSLMMIGAPGRVVRFYNAPHFELGDEGVFDLKLPAEGDGTTIVAVIDNLHTDPPEAIPGQTEQVKAAEDHSFGDRISSFRFDP